jgi:hypothetical protein
VAELERNKLEIVNGLTDREYGRYTRQGGGEYIVTRFMDQAGKGFKASDESRLLESYAKRYAKYGIRCADPKRVMSLVRTQYTRYSRSATTTHTESGQGSTFRIDARN